MNNLFQSGNFTLHSGDISNFKIECDALTLYDWQTIAKLIASKFSFSVVIDVPQGGVTLAACLIQYITSSCHTLLIVDDVLSTGNSMETMKQKCLNDLPDYQEKDIKGVVLFARGKCPDWVTPIFQMWEE